MKNFTSVKSILLLTCCMGLKLFAQNPLQYQLIQQGGGNCAGSPVELSVATAVRLSTTAASGITASSAISGGIVTNDGGNAVTQRGICYSTNPNPTTANSTTSNGSGLGAFTSNLEGLLPNTTYYVRAYAINSAGTFYGNEIQLTSNAINFPPATHACGIDNIHNPNTYYGYVSDIDGNVYKTVTIGNQEWMAENLKVTRYRNGDLIASNLNNNEWINATQGAWAFFNNNSTFDCPYGKLYNWYAIADSRHVCPTGWHEPSYAEWGTLTTFLSNNGGALKSTAIQYWGTSNIGATNSSGFSGLPGGYRGTPGDYVDFGARGYYWSTTSNGPNNAFYRRMYVNSTLVDGPNTDLQVGMSIRCIKDVTSSLPATIDSLACQSAINTGTITSNQQVIGASTLISYTGGNGGFVNGQSYSSTGVLGLTASIAPGLITLGTGTITINITGNPVTSGIANFQISIGGQNCILSRMVSVSAGNISALVCSSASNNGMLTQGIAANGVSSTVPYTGGNGGSYSGQTVNSTGVAGLTATLTAGSFVNGAGSLTYTITGTPATSGTASFALSIGGQACTINRIVNLSVGAVAAINCAKVSNSGTLTEGEAAFSVNSVIPYTGGNGGTYNGETISSIGVLGLIATLTTGTFTNNDGNLIYSITGVPTSSGLASFTLNIGGQSYTLSRVVNSAGQININQHTCGASNIHNSAKDYGSMTDQDGNEYKTIMIGNLELMAENLRTSTYANGDSIPNVTDANDWFQLNSGAWCYYNNDDQFNCPYGKLYNWYTISDPRNICPVGWHVPTDLEWNLLIGFFDPTYSPTALGIQGQTAGGKLKSTSGWNSPNIGATNISGFSGVAGGARGTSNGCFNNIGNIGNWWSATSNDAMTARYRYLRAADAYAYRLSSNKLNAFSVRCIRD
jgi:uncharacterized protein (TIGR02145 family)